MELWDMVVRMASSLAMVVALMLVLAVAAKRALGSRLPATSGAALVQVVGSGYLGPRKTVSLVSVAGELLILGTTQTDIVPLGRLSDAEQIKRVLSGMKEPGGAAGGPIRFQWWQAAAQHPLAAPPAVKGDPDGKEGHV